MHYVSVNFMYLSKGQKSILCRENNSHSQGSQTTWYLKHLGCCRIKIWWRNGKEMVAGEGVKQVPDKHHSLKNSLLWDSRICLRWGTSRSYCLPTEPYLVQTAQAQHHHMGHQIWTSWNLRETNYSSHRIPSLVFKEHAFLTVKNTLSLGQWFQNLRSI